MDGTQIAFQTVSGQCPDGGDQVHEEDDGNGHGACNRAGMPSSDVSPEGQPSWTWLKIGGPSPVKVEGGLQKGSLARQYGSRLGSGGGSAQAMDTLDLRYSTRETRRTHRSLPAPNGQWRCRIRSGWAGRDEGAL
ncbi:MAG: hypothetical protein LQ350_006068 [Teloschistes chrysophthalmus]|nr:MAG: hypothetical protein LQ350_006068 [Niorma chrysophthalma]